MTPNIVICKGLLVRSFYACVTSIMHNIKKDNKLPHCSTHTIGSILMSSCVYVFCRNT